ncbi:rhodanese-like protein [Halteromyces radiatus]|uniref:rhodanese-like protein n=1 Tax=Halteromyces radiatus TaxID=101107 RepID=UPI0022206046|nr:rhodanese-like protein [Halteromyces radiatus]KAI8093855.1 rhodanese-like protein [Halteromyces radiatus]
MCSSRWIDHVKNTKEQYGVQEITADELQAALQEKDTAPVLIDVRETDEWKTGKLPTAVGLPRGILELKVENVVSPDSQRPIVLYCAGGLRSIMTAASLIGMGYNKENIKSLTGGFGSWAKKGYTVVKD